MRVQQKVWCVETDTQKLKKQMLTFVLSNNGMNNFLSPCEEEATAKKCQG